MARGQLAGEHALVTGGAGFIGSHLVDRLLSLGSDVTVLDNLSHGHRSNVAKDAQLLIGDVRDSSLVEQAIAGKSRVFHLAAEATTRRSAMGWIDPVYDLNVNALGTLTILEAARAVNKSARFLLASSAAVYGPPIYTPMDEHHPTDPISPYGVSKLAAEKYAVAYSREQGMATSVARIFNTYGPRQRRYVMYELIRKLQSSPARLELIGDGSQVRDYTYVSDTVTALILMSDAPPGSVMNISSGHHISIRDLADLLSALVAPGALVEPGRPTWKGDISELVGDPTVIRTELGFSTEVDLEAGLAKLAEWVLAEPLHDD